MAARNYCYMNVVPFCAMVAVQCSSVVVSVLFKAATQRGMSYYVFIFYSYAISTFVLLLPMPVIFSRWGLIILHRKPCSIYIYIYVFILRLCISLFNGTGQLDCLHLRSLCSGGFFSLEWLGKYISILLQELFQEPNFYIVNAILYMSRAEYWRMENVYI